MRRSIVFGVLVTALARTVAAQSGTPTTLVEEIEAFPAEMTGTWTIGGRAYTAEGTTVLEPGIAPAVGKLAEVEFVQRDGAAVLVRIEPWAIGPDEVSDGPYVFWRDADTVEVVAFCRGEVRRQIHDDVTAPIEVPTLCGADETVTLHPGPAEPPAPVWEAPSRLLAISDIEGNYDALLRFLTVNGVVDGEGGWAWGDGHLLFDGDIVDRGDRVTETMWLIRRLEHEAAAAGGRVHYVLGNHEAMVMAGDLRYIHPKYRFTAARLGIEYHDLYGPTSEIGRWWRSRNSIVRVGPLLFVHAGYSPRLDALGLEIGQINEMIRTRLGPPAWPSRGDLATSLTWHAHGPLWYRGYFDEFAPALGGVPADDQLAAILRRHSAQHIVVGHTVVEHVGWLDAGKRLIGIDVEWRRPGAGEGLLLEKGELWRLGAGGRRGRLEE